MQLSLHGDTAGKLKLVRAINQFKLELPTEYKIFREALETESRTLYQDLREGEGPALHRAQGHAQRLSELCGFLDESAELQRSIMRQLQRSGKTPS